MIVFEKISDYKNELQKLREERKSIGFVPTMGALHAGHLSLIERAKKENDITVCSIFVNPTQFNNKEDLKKYPRTLETDISLLKKQNCDILFAPDENEIYPSPSPSKMEKIKVLPNGEDLGGAIDFGNLDKVMEGKFRPGHFRGVAMVVNKLFRIIEPQNAYFGEKDYQQLQIVKKMTEVLKHNVRIIPCATIRESDGLAMSSRNVRLTSEERKVAPFIYRVLTAAKELVPAFSVPDIKKWAENKFEQNKIFRLEYFEIADAETLQSVKTWSETKSAVACVAVHLGSVRLIDNIKILVTQH